MNNFLKFKLTCKKTIETISQNSKIQKIIIFLAGVIFTLIPWLVSMFISSYPQWGDYLNKNGIKDPLLKLFESKSERFRNTSSLCEESTTSEDEYDNNGRHERLNIYLSEILLKKKVIFQEIESSWKNGTHNSIYFAYQKAIDSYKDLWVGLSWFYDDCSKNIFEQYTTDFLYEFEDLKTTQYEITFSFDGFKGHWKDVNRLSWMLFQYDQLILDAIERHSYEYNYQKFQAAWRKIDEGFHNSTNLYVNSITSKEEPVN